MFNRQRHADRQRHKRRPDIDLQTDTKGQVESEPLQTKINRLQLYKQKKNTVKLDIKLDRYENHSDTHTDRHKYTGILETNLHNEKKYRFEDLMATQPKAYNTYTNTSKVQTYRRKSHPWEDVHTQDTQRPSRYRHAKRLKSHKDTHRHTNPKGNKTLATQTQTVKQSRHRQA